jgi:hypothetical protein
MSDLTARLDAIQARKDAASPGPWEASQGATSDGSELVTTYQQKTEFLALSLNSGRSGLWLVDNSEVIPAVTGDGPRAKANAEFIANAPTDIGFLLDLARKQQAAIDAVTARLDEWDAMEPFPDVDKTQAWYSLGKRHASEAIRFEIREALEAKSHV